MTNRDVPGGDHGLSPSPDNGSWRPQADDLPAPYCRISIAGCYPDEADRGSEPLYVGQKIVYPGFESGPNKPVVLVFSPTPARSGEDELHSDSATPPDTVGRFTIDLSGHADWRCKVDVIRLGCVLHLRLGEIQDDDSGFEITNFIALGGYGEVWEARDRSRTDSDGYVALKFLQPSNAVSIGSLSPAEGKFGSELTREAVTREIPKFVVPVHDSATIDDHTRYPRWPRQWISMARAGCSLADVVKVGQALKSQQQNAGLPLVLVTKICRRLITVLSELHRRNYVHCDLKPDNILFLNENRQDWDGELSSLLQNDVQIVLADLASATQTGEVPTERFQQDSGGHRAPEILPRDSSGKAPAHPSEDRFALGVIFQALADVLDGDGEWLRTVADRLTAEAPGERPPLDQALRNDVSPVWQAVNRLLTRDGGWKIGHQDYERLVGREWLRDIFEDFCSQQRAKQEGGLFVLSADAGLGKTAILTHWHAAERLGCRGNEPTTDCEGQLRPGFYFRVDSGAGMQSHLIPALVAQLQAEPFNVTVPERSIDNISERDLMDMLQQALRSLPHDQSLVLIIDGLDEAADPQDAVRVLKNLCHVSNGSGLPDRVFILVAARPKDADGKALTTKLAQLGDFVGSIQLEKNDRRNVEDAIRFWKEECRRALPQGLIDEAVAAADQAVQAADGILFILRSAIDEIKRANLQLSEFLSQEVCTSVIMWHEKQWERITNRLDPTTEGKIIDLARFLTVIREPVPTHLLAAWLRMTKGEVQPMLNRVAWLTVRFRAESPMDGSTISLWFRRHRSVQDFLFSLDDVGENLAEVHRKVGNHFVDEAISNSADEMFLNWADTEYDYGLRHVVAHFLAASGTSGDGRTSYRQALKLLTDQLYLNARLNS